MKNSKVVFPSFADSAVLGGKSVRSISSDRWKIFRLTRLFGNLKRSFLIAVANQGVLLHATLIFADV